MVWQDGLIIGPYQITGRIGTGGMATVYRASQARLEREVAIKVMHQSFAMDKNFRARFEREAKIAARLDHPNIITIYDYDEYDNQPFLVLKYVEGHTLKHLLRKGALTPEQTEKIVLQIADALSYAHSQGVLHRDVKPSNIVVDARGNAYLMDFGLARLLMQGESTMSAETMLGTPHYISPEQAQGKTDIDARADVYSLGVVLFELVTGRVPFMADTSFAVIHDHIYNPPPDPRTIKADVPVALVEVLQTALAKDPAQRYATANELVEAFVAATEGSVITAPAQQIAPTPITGSTEDVAQGEDETPSEQRARGVAVKMGSKPILIAGNNAFNDKMTEQQHREESEDDEASSDADAGLSEEEILRRRVRKRMKKSRERFSGLVSSFLAFIFVNFIIFDAGDWLSQMNAQDQLIAPPFMLWFTFVLWGFGLLTQLVEWWTNFGPGREWRERRIDREVARERDRIYGTSEVSKRKNDYADNTPLRLTDEGELTDSFIEEIEKPKKRM